MTVYELNRKQLVELKQNYMFRLADEGIFGEVVFDNEGCEEPSYDDMANVDSLIPDEIIFEHYDGIEFTEDDFFDKGDE